MLATTDFWLILLLFLTATLYASVGHGGASGYLAVMAVMGITPDVMKPTALILNVFTSGIATIGFYRVNYFDWQLFSVFAIASIPCAFIGGKLSLPEIIYKPILGLVLLYTALRLLSAKKTTAQLQTSRKIPLEIAILAGMAIGLISGLTGVGGGIFLSPLLILSGWASPQTTAGVSAAFILVNSLAGLLGLGLKVSAVPPSIVFWGLAVSTGGWVGARYAIGRIDNINLQRLLGLLLIAASWKMLSALF